MDMAEVAVESSANAPVNAGITDDASEVKDASQEDKADTVDAPATNGHAMTNNEEQSTTKNKPATESCMEPAEEKSSKKAGKERNSSEDTKTPIKRKAKAVEKVSEEEDDDKEASPVKKRSKKEVSTNDTEAESSKEKKAAKSKPKASDDEDGDEDEDEDDNEEDEELKPGLLERPVVLEEGVKREKKKVQRLDLTPSADKADSVKKVEIAEGSGTKLGELPRVEFQLQKTHAEELKPLHRLLFDRVGSAFEVKKNIRRFSGFTFSESSTEFQKKKEKLSKFTSAMLKSICEVLDIERGGKKEEIIDRILNFLMKPHSSGKNLPSAKKRRRSSTDKSKKSKGKKSKSEKSKSKKKEAKSKADGSGDDDDEEEESSGDEDEPSQSESESEEDSKKKKKQTKKATPGKKSVKTPTKTPKSADKSSAKRVTKKQSDTPKKKSATPKKAKAESSEDSGDEDEPLAKKNSPPTDDVLRNVIKKILKTANLEEVTMKTVCKQVYDKFPEFDLTSRKDFIKTTVKQILK